MRGTPAGGPCEGKGGVQGTEPRIKGPRPKKDLPIINKPLVADAVVLKRRGVVVTKMGVTSPCSDPRLVANTAPVGSGDRVRLVLPLGPD